MKANKPAAIVALPSIIYETKFSTHITLINAAGHTKIHDQPRYPCVPLMKLIPYARSPLKAPASEAEP